MTYVLSDIHGNAARFYSVMKQISLQPEDTLYVLGDVIDRYPDGIRILRLLMRMPNVKLLLGNHEYMMLNALDGPEPGDSRALRLWYRNGGNVTHAYLKHIRRAIRQEIFDYLRTLPLNLEIEVNGQAYLLVHGGVLDRYCEHTDRYGDPVHYAFWYRMDCTEPELEGKPLSLAIRTRRGISTAIRWKYGARQTAGKSALTAAAASRRCRRRSMLRHTDGLPVCGWRMAGCFIRKKRFLNSRSRLHNLHIRL